MTGVDIVRVPPDPRVRAWSEKNGFSPELVARWVRFLPEPEKQLASFLKPVPRYVRVNTLRTDPDRLRRSLERRGFVLEPVTAPDERLAMLRVKKEPFALAAGREHLAGECYLQDLASVAAAAALEPEPGERILDMAAAPGGKTTAIAELVGDNASILAVDPQAHRAAALTANLRRLGIAGVAVAVRPAQSIALGRGFDRILLDAPCTGEGVLPKDRTRRRGHLEEHAACATLQRTLIDHAARLLVPGGTFVYSTCTFAPEECEGAVAHAVSLGLEPVPLPFDALGDVPLAPPLVGWGDAQAGDEARHARRIYPYKHATLGFFLARFQKPHDAGALSVPAAAGVPVEVAG